ncbi:MAG: helix-turn-helix transcriptional regulator [Gemmatimonadota bacterium]
MTRADSTTEPLRYREHAPNGALASLVRCYWTVRGRAAALDPAINRVLPDGCMDVIFDLHEPADGGGMIIGTMLTASVFHHTGEIDMLGVRFVPGAAPLFLRTAAGELTGATLPASAVWPDTSDLAGRLLEGTDTRQRLVLLDRYLLDQLKPAAESDAALRGMALIERARGQLRVEMLCRSLGINERTLQRSFANQVGLTPKQAIRVMRFRHAVTLLQGSPRGSLASIALSCGYADQSHFTREFRDLADVSPLEFARERGLVGFVQDAAYTET